MKEITAIDTTTLNFDNETTSLRIYNSTTSLNFSLRDYDNSYPIFQIVLDFLDVVTWGDIF